ncbi:MAG: OmpA family protein [Gammaproteobacteria bacterium]
MSQLRPTRRFLLAAMASCSVLLAASTSMAQTVRIFEEAPSLEQLRSIMIPESRGSMARTIVMKRPDAGMTRPAAMQPAAIHADVQAPVPTPAVATPEPPVARPVAHPVARIAPPVAKAPAAQEQVADAGIVGFRINFAFDSAAIPASAHAFIERIAELMRAEPQVKLRIEGHTDAQGAAGYNQVLSERRALSVAEYLVNQLGIEPNRLVLIGKGMSEPVAEDPYAPQNRRVQFVRVS